MTASLQFTLSNPVAGREDEYNEWYGNDHLVNGVLTPGVWAGQRFRRTAGPWPAGKHNYLVIWEFHDPDYALEQLALRKGTDTMPLSPAIDLSGIQPPTMWLRASACNYRPFPTSFDGRRTSVLVLANALQAQAELFERELLGGGLAYLADLQGVRQADFYTLANKQIRGNARKYAYALLLELYEENAGIASLDKQIPTIPHLDPDRWLAPIFRPLGKRVTTPEAQSLALSQSDRKVA